MDMEQEELQFLGFFGICKEAIAITFRRSKIFAKLTLTLILPPSIIFLAHDGFSTFLSQKITNATQLGTPAFNDESNKISSELTTLWLIKLVYLLISLVFSLPSISAIVYTVACIYIGKDISYKKVMRVVPTVWKRVMVTFLWSFGMIFAFSLLFVIVIIILLYLNQYPDTPISLYGRLVMLTILFQYLLGFVHLSVQWQLATVISVMEDTYGIQAIAKSRILIQGKSGISVAIFLAFFLCLVGIEYTFESVTDSSSTGIGSKIGYGIVSLVGLTLLFLFGFVVQTIVYFVCKSYHHQNIDKSSLADHLEAYREEYVPLTSKDKQMKQFQV